MYRTARTTPLSRVDLLREAERLGVAQAARNFCVSRNTVYRWRRRQGELEDRSCRPQRSPRRTPQEREAAVLVLRMERRWGPDRIGPALGLSRRTAYRVLRRHGAHRLRTLFPAQPRSRGVFTATEPGEVVQIDIKSIGRLGRGGGRAARRTYAERHRSDIGWSHAHLAVDAASRQAYVELRTGLGSLDCAAFLRNAIAHFDSRGIRVRRVLTDNGTGYKRIFGAAVAELGLRWSRTKPYHPWTNGRVERFNRTLQRECLYAGEYFTSDEQRRYAIALWLADYHAHRPHRGLRGLTPDAWLRRRNVTWV
ncbi:MAG: IS481 family transposase [Chloroflexota bacterium]|nr:IS481 family transposase [Chloroflexota bacterium]